MLQTNDLMLALQKGLNDYAKDYNVDFKFFDTIGDYIDAQRGKTRATINDVTFLVQGVFSLAPSQLIPVKNLNIANLQAMLEIELDIDKLPEELDEQTLDVIDYPQVRLVRNILDGYAQSQNGLPIIIKDSAGKSYSVVPTYSLNNAGLVTMNSSNTGEVLPITFSVVYTVVENGLNTNDITILIDNEEVFFDECSITRTRVADTLQFSDAIATKTTILQNGLGIDLRSPILTTKLGDRLLIDLFDGGNNTAHCVIIKTPDITRCFLMTFGNLSATLQIAQNLGANISLVEVVPDLAIYNSDWTTEQVIISTPNTQKTYTDLPANACVFWGDGTSTVCTGATDTTHIYPKTGTYYVYVYNPESEV